MTSVSLLVSLRPQKEWVASCNDGVLAFLLGAILALQKRLPVLVKLDTSDDHLGRVDTNWHCLSVCLVSGHPLNMNDPFLAVDLNNLAFTVMVVATDNHHFVIFANRQRAHGILGAQILAEGCRHQL